MRIPSKPPDIYKITQRVLEGSHLADLTKYLRPTDSKNRYLHWDELRRRPAPVGITHEEWWAMIKLARRPLLTATTLTDIAGGAFAFFETDEIRRGLHFIDSQARGQISSEQPISVGDSANYYVIRSLIEEPYSSSVLEGAATTRQAAEQMIEGQKQPSNNDERMVLNNYRAMRLIKDLKSSPLTVDMILNIHAELTSGTLSSSEHVGQLRRATDSIVVEDHSTHEVLHVPPPADTLLERLQAICDFANHPLEGAPFIHPILRAAILHFMIGYDHPFVDGNGRTARALFYWSALRSGYWLLEFSSISKEIRDAPVKYGLAYLLSETDECDLTYFLSYHIEVIVKAIQSLNSYFERKSLELKAFEAIVRPPGKKRRFNDRQIRLLEQAIKRPGIAFTIELHQRQAGVSYLTARADLESLHKKGMLKKIQDGNRSIYLSKDRLVDKLGLPAREAHLTPLRKDF